MENNSSSSGLVMRSHDNIYLKGTLGTYANPSTLYIFSLGQALFSLSTDGHFKRSVLV